MSYEVDPEGEVSGGLGPPGKSQVAIDLGFLRKSGMDHPRKAIESIGSN